jgi:hypothetical protein
MPLEVAASSRPAVPIFPQGIGIIALPAAEHFKSTTPDAFA